MRASNFSAPAAVVSVSVLIESIGTAWRTGSQSLEHGADDALRRRVGRDELGMRRLDRLQLLEQRVVVGVGDRRRVEHVVGVRVTLELLAQLRRPRAAGSRADLRSDAGERTRQLAGGPLRCSRSRSGPHQSGEKSPLPRASAAARSGAIAAVASGNAGRARRRRPRASGG